MLHPCRRAVILAAFTCLVLLACPWVIGLSVGRAADRPDVSLLSAVVFFPERRNVAVPDKMLLKFYVRDKAPVSVVIRSLDSTKYYNCVIGKEEVLGPGFVNRTWSAQEARSGWPDMKVSSVGALASIHRGSDKSHYWITPVIFYQTRAPMRVESYVFTFWSPLGATANAVFARESGTRVPGSHLPGQVQPMRVFSEKPFAVYVDCSGLEAGMYKLVLNIKFESGRSAVKTVHFYHRPDVN